MQGRVKLLEFDVGKYEARPSAEAYHIKEFKVLISRDRGSDGDSQGRKKLRASKELAWIFHTTDWTSPYVQNLYGDQERLEEEVKKAVFENEEWKPDEIVLTAKRVYEDLVSGPNVRLILGAFRAVNQMTEYFNEVDFKERDTKDNLLYSPKSVFDAINAIPKATEGLTGLLDQIRKEEAGANRTRGGVVVNEFND